MSRPRISRIHVWSIIVCAVVLAAFSQATMAKTLCVNSHGAKGCYSTIQSAVDQAASGDIIQVAAGVYDEEVTVGKPLSLLGAGPDETTIDAAALAHGVFVDGFDNPGLKAVTVSGFTIKNALYEGVLVVSASDVVIRDNRVIDNDKSPGLSFTGALTGCPGQPGSGVYENDETGDCGGAIHLIGTIDSIVSDNLVTGNADGLLISDETAESRGNLIAHNVFKDNPLECGIVLASHPPTGHTSPPFAPHFGVDDNIVVENVSTRNGVKVGGAGAGVFSDGDGPGTVTGNVIAGNELTDNGLGGVDLHTHVGPALGLPADNMDGNVIAGNFIAGNLADTMDTATPGPVGININSGGGGSPVHGTIILRNVIRDEAVDIAVNDPASVAIHLNDLLGGKIGVANVCAFDNPTNPSVCTGSIDAAENFWGCAAGPGAAGCSTTSGAAIVSSPALDQPVAEGDHISQSGGP